MFSNLTGSLPQIVGRLGRAENEEDFQNAFSDLKRYLKEAGLSAECLQELERRAYYLSNDYSQKDTKERIEQAKKRVREYIDEWMNLSMEDRWLVNILDNFYLFLEGLIERVPHKKGGIQKEQLELIKIKNEYDVQHLLFAYLYTLLYINPRFCNGKSIGNAISFGIRLNTGILQWVCRLSNGNFYLITFNSHNTAFIITVSCCSWATNHFISI